jgi:putative endonuclease
VVAPHLQRGRRGEELAADWYTTHGYRVVARNWRCAVGELDVVARRGRLVVVCEVKSRRSEAFGPAAAAVGVVKQQRLRRLAAAWLADNGVHGVEVRFDVAAVTGDRLEVIPGAF